MFLDPNTHESTEISVQEEKLDDFTSSNSPFLVYIAAKEAPKSNITKLVIPWNPIDNKFEFSKANLNMTKGRLTTKDLKTLEEILKKGESCEFEQIYKTPELIISIIILFLIWLLLLIFIVFIPVNRNTKFIAFFFVIICSFIKCGIINCACSRIDKSNLKLLQDRKEGLEKLVEELNNNEFRKKEIRINFGKLASWIEVELLFMDKLVKKIDQINRNGGEGCLEPKDPLFPKNVQVTGGFEMNHVYEVKQYVPVIRYSA